jgi:plasmid stabilization system protein ParE
MKIEWTDFAVEDLIEIRDFYKKDDKAYAAKLTKEIRAKVNTLRDWPLHKGTYITELEDLNLTDFRQILHEQYRIIFEFDEHQQLFVIHIVCHTHRDLTALLQRRYRSVSI